MTIPAAEPAANTVPANRRQALLESYSRLSAGWMSGLALIYLGVFTLQAILYEPQATWYLYASLFGYLLWVIFVFDLAFRFILTKKKRGFFRANWLDTITVVIPQLRALRALRAFTSGGILARRGKGVISSGAIATAALSTALIVWVGSLMVLNAERDAPNATITSFGDALWWAMETVTTVGYGDMIPVTVWGRIIAVSVMVFGIGAVGAVSAGLAATLVKRSSTAPAPADVVIGELNRLQAMVAELQARLPAPEQTAIPAPAPESGTTT